MKTYSHARWQSILAALVICSGALFLTAQVAQAADGGKAEANDGLTKGAVMGKWTQDYDAALKLAKEKNVPVFLNFTGSDWCPWCQLMDRRVFDTAQWNDYAKDHVVLVTLDFPRNKDLVPQDFRERNQQLQAKFGIQGYPTYVILDPDGKTELGRLGADRNATPAMFISEMKELLRRSPAGVDKLAKKLSPAVAKQYRQAITDLHTAQADEKAWMATVEKQTPAVMEKYKGFETRIATADAAAYKIESDYLISTLDKDKAAALRELLKEEAAAKTTLNSWLATDPKPTTANRQKYGELSGKLSTLHQQVESYWK